MQVENGAGDVTFPEWRGNVLEALRALSDDTLHELWRRRQGWPDLDSAVHWLIDDTFMDVGSAREMVPELFRSEREADTVQAAVDALIAVVDALGDVSAEVYLRHPGWPKVFVTATAAARALEEPAL
ncbi:hypothetical protein ACIBH1_31830 [Nonomuraea sp. NPDC050663]|uniref:SCO4402 family protein n=1 Tax=Nonomuraea sp. NPDC050663 TaxID=3364370 RepID=UPI0037AD69D2